MRRVIAAAAAAAAAVVVTSVAPRGAEAQAVVDYDYENLSFRGISFDVGHLSADNVSNTTTLGVRFDLGFLGPGFRLTPGVTYWESTLARAQVNRFENRLGLLNQTQGGTAPQGGFDLGVIDRSDVIVTLDGEYVWAVPYDMFFSTGVGVSAHFLNGSGPAIDGTFVEDLLDSASAGFNLHAALEYPLAERVRIYGGSKVEVLGDLNYFEFRAGLTFIWGELVEGRDPVTLETESSPARMGILGVGAVTQIVHLPMLSERPDVDVVAVSDPDQLKAETLGARFQVPRVLSDEEILSDDEVDAAVICTPNHLHESLAIGALERGKHVLVEKPLAMTQRVYSGCWTRQTLRAGTSPSG